MDSDDQKDKDKKWQTQYHWTEAQLAEMRECFALFDQKNEGTILRSDLGNALRALGQNPTEAEVQEMIGQCEVKDAPEPLNLDEFITLIGTRGLKSEMEMEDELEDAMRVFDKDGSGIIDADELKAALRNLGEPIDDDDIAELLKVAEVDSDGKLGYSEFVRRMVAK